MECSKVNLTAAINVLIVYFYTIDISRHHCILLLSQKAQHLGRSIV